MRESFGSLRLEQVAVGALSDITLTIPPTEVVCLSGRSGSGKSRLLRAIADLDVHAGRVWLGETEQSATPAHLWRQQVMLVPAESQWWAERVEDHFPVATVMDGLAELGFEPDVMGWSVSRLSSGEKQRLALLRAMARRPAALLLDEPTANLDQESVAAMERWLLAAVRERQLPVLWVAHTPDQIQRVAQRHFRLSGSSLEAQ
ncbi:ABC transporter ATP-binding protein [Marinobacter caseinilyticus]|uniref:ABC transporter ATP-binding protein n=1 Tax=Marinobacter caseinilyticus TaxID=2692195 RepID=UPI00140D84AB|nr:ATP-binding cassette domain-containing protein [Marinobacter caseinilyticus]